LLVASLSSKPVGLEISEAVTAFNVEGLDEDNYLAATSLSEAITTAQITFTDELIKTFLEQRFRNEEFRRLEARVLTRSVTEDSWTTSNLALRNAILDSDPGVQFLRTGGVIPGTNTVLPENNITSGGFPRFSVFVSRLPAPDLFMQFGGATNDADGSPTFYEQFEFFDPVTFRIINSSYIDLFDPPCRTLWAIGEQTADRFGSVIGVSGDPIHWGRWNATSGDRYTFETIVESPENPLGFSTTRFEGNSSQWITFIPSSLSSLRAVRGTRHYTNTAFVFGDAAYGQQIFPLGDKRLDDFQLIPITKIISNFSLDFGTRGAGFALGDGTIDVVIADGSKWHFDFTSKRLNRRGLQAGTNKFQALPNVTSLHPTFGGEGFAFVGANVFSAHSRVCGPHCPAAGFAGMFIGVFFQEITDVLQNPDATVTGTFVLTTP